MNAAAPHTWTDANQQLLVAEFAALRSALGDTGAPAADLRAVRAELSESAAIAQLTTIFGLSNFERDVLLLLAGLEMDAELARLVPHPTFAFALARLQGGHWSALTPLGPLRAWRLVGLDGTSPAHARLHIDERILHHLAGVSQLDVRLAPYFSECPAPNWMDTQQRAQAQVLAQAIAAAGSVGQRIWITGDDPFGRRDVAAETARLLRRPLFNCHAHDLPPGAVEQDLLALLWQREAALLPAALMIDAADCSAASHEPLRLSRFLDRPCGPLFVSCEQGDDPRATQRLSVDKPSPEQQPSLWASALADEPESSGLHEQARSVAGHFRLSAAQVAQLAKAARSADPAWERGQGAGGGLWAAASGLARRRLDELAERVPLRASWGDLVLPAPLLAALEQLVAQCRQRQQVYVRWGFAGKSARGLGIGALFAGGSGVGKTMACEVLAQELALDLYRIDLAGVVSKYIGETEKNLARVFDAAEDAGAMLLFDEADALFGRRSEVKDSHDRYANIEVSYLLQRMETYRGLAVLTSNLRSGLDPAFMRRLRFVLQFPFPDLEQREAIWRRVFPATTPLADLNHTQLAALPLAGGAIRNVALNAAFAAAQAGTPVTMALLARAAHQEAAKADRPLQEAHTRGWSQT